MKTLFVLLLLCGVASAGVTAQRSVLRQRSKPALMQRLQQARALRQSRRARKVTRSVTRERGGLASIQVFQGSCPTCQPR